MLEKKCRFENKAKSKTLFYAQRKRKNAHKALGNVSRQIARLIFMKALSLSPSTTGTGCGGSRSQCQHSKGGGRRIGSLRSGQDSAKELAV